MANPTLLSLERTLKQHFGDQVSERVMHAMTLPPSVSLRLNPNKPGQPPQDAYPVPWHPQGYLLRERPVFALDPHFHSGAYYVQDSSSMILARILDALPLPERPLCLDACAAPGGKSSILLDALDGKGFLIANEVDEKRQRILQENLLKWGHTNYAITSEQVERFGDQARFQLILVDAPCSGEGMFRKDTFAQEQWGPQLIAQCTHTQTEIVDDATMLLEEGGWMIYATCTMNSDENEQQIIRLLETGEYVLATPELPYEDHLIRIDHKGALLGYYLLPGISTGEGLFIAVLRKVSPTTPLKTKSSKKKHRSTKSSESVSLEPLQQFDLQLESGVEGLSFGDSIHVVSEMELVGETSLKLRMIGQPAFKQKGKDVIPEHGLAMMESMKMTLALNREEALAYIRKEVLSLAPEMDLGWHVVSYEGRHLGWIKAIQGRTNNYYPGWLRLRM